PAVANRQAALAALEARADRDAAALALGAGGVDRHVEHRRAHRAHAVDAAVLPVQAAVDVVEAVFERADAALDSARVEADQLLDGDVGVLVCGGERGGVAGGHVVADRVFAAVCVGGGLVERVRVAGAGDFGGDAAHLVLVQAVQAAAGRTLRALRTCRALRTGRALRACGALRASRTLRTRRATRTRRTLRAGCAAAGRC